MKRADDWVSFGKGLAYLYASRTRAYDDLQLAAYYAVLEDLEWQDVRRALIAHAKKPGDFVPSAGAIRRTAIDARRYRELLAGAKVQVAEYTRALEQLAPSEEWPEQIAGRAQPALSAEKGER